MSGVAICSFCKKSCVKFQRCSSCKKDSYCDKKCQRLAWKDHKIDCKPINDVCDILLREYAADNMDEILRWKSRFDEIVACNMKPFSVRLAILHVVMKAYESLLPLCAYMPTMDRTEAELESHVNHRKLSAVQSRAAEFMCLMECYRDQGGAICSAGEHMLYSDDVEQAIILFKKARNIAESHGFYIVECLACHGLGNCYSWKGDDKEAIQFLQNSLIAAPLCEHSCDSLEMLSTEAVASSLYVLNRYDEAETLMPRLRELTRNYSLEHSTLKSIEVGSFFLRIRLCEQRGEMANAAMELRELGVLLHENIVHVLDHAGTFLSMLHGLMGLRVFELGYRLNDPIFKVWDVYEQVGGFVSRRSGPATAGPIDAHGYMSAARVNECQ
jgi:tetratricopeptide (TPR) repeat protein